MHLRTGFRTSSSFYSSTSNWIFQGVIQGNGAALVVWLLLSILLVKYLYSLELIPQLITLLSLVLFQLAASLYIDDTNINIRNNSTESESDIIARAQKLISVWQDTLRLTGGDLKI